MLAEMDKLRKSNRRAEERGEDTRQQHLSAERQKRALTERVRDLEKQLSDITAEREQFELENKTLVNRVRLLPFRKETPTPSRPRTTTCAPSSSAYAPDR